MKINKNVRSKFLILQYMIHVFKEWYIQCNSLYV